MHSTTKGREETTSKNVGSVERFGREMDCCHCGREKAVVAEKGERQTSTEGSTWGEKNPHSNWLGQQEGPSSMTSGNLWGLNPGVLKVSEHGWDRAWRASHCSWRKGRQTTHEHRA